MLVSLISWLRQKSPIERAWALAGAAINIANIIALAFAYVQIRQAGDTQRTMKVIVDGLYTRFLARFPANIEPITKLVEATKSGQLVIITDVLGYGQFSGNADFEKFLHALEELPPTVRVDWITFDESGRNAMRARQFDAPLAELLTDKEFKRSFDHFYEHYKYERAADREKFLGDLADAERDALTPLLKRGNVEVHPVTLDTELPMFCWMSVDRSDAVYSFVTFAKGAQEVAFRTTDENFIEILKQVAEKVMPGVVEQETTHSGRPPLHGR